LPDRLGSIRNITDANGNPVDTITYDGFGNVTNETSIANGDRWKFTGREFDSETGLQFNRARYYDGTDGRWVNQDSLGFWAGDPNLYRYVQNDPTNVVDPSGLQPPNTGGGQGSSGGLGGTGGWGQPGYPGPLGTGSPINGGQGGSGLWPPSYPGLSPSLNRRPPNPFAIPPTLKDPIVSFLSDKLPDGFNYNATWFAEGKLYKNIDVPQDIVLILARYTNNSIHKLNLLGHGQFGGIQTENPSGITGDSITLTQAGQIRRTLARDAEIWIFACGVAGPSDQQAPGNPWWTALFKLAKKLDRPVIASTGDVFWKPNVPFDNPGIFGKNIVSNGKWWKFPPGGDRPEEVAGPSE
jgi:RHS repeat-associated protein